MKQNTPVMWISLPNNTLACACSGIQWNGYLLLPATGYRSNSSGAGSNRGSDGHYWSAEVSGVWASYLYFDSSSARLFPDKRTLGFSVRCVQGFTEV